MYSIYCVVFMIVLAVPPSWSFFNLWDICTPENIPLNITALKLDLEQHLYGQPLAMEIIHILNGYKRSIDLGSQKALTISFHGMPGIGKSFVASFIANSLFKDGLKSPFARMYIGREDFPSKIPIVEHQERLRNDIREIVKKCGVALIIFDEVNDIPPEVLGVLKPMMDHHGEINGVNYSKVIFIFLSNLGGKEIATEFYNLDMPREDLLFTDFNDILRNALNEALAVKNNGFTLVYSDLIDHYIPFLPLETEHVEKCIKAEFQRQGVSRVADSLVEKVISTVKYMDITDEEIFVESGCKKIKNQVVFFLTRDEL